MTKPAPQKTKRSSTKRRGFSKRIEHKPESKKDDRKARAPISNTVVGIVTKAKFGWTLTVANRRDKNDYVIRGKDKAENLENTLVAARLLPTNKRGRQEIEITDNLGDSTDPHNISIMAIYGNEVPFIFPKKVIRESQEAKPVTDKDRTDLRQIPLVTIDGADSRDFDDAVFAECDGTGWHIVVAIADVAHYVTAESALDKEAYKRGNSTYFPDRVVPMLPEALSNNLCSLMPTADRACMAAHIWINELGKITKFDFVRGVMHSKARLTYEQVQAAKDGSPDDATKPLIKDVIDPLYAAYDCLTKARQKRGTLELDLPERQVHIAKDGTVKTISVRERLDSHRLIEEFMILANVAAASALSNKENYCLYRVHDKPSDEKLEALRDFLDTLGISLVPGRQLEPKMLTQVLNKVAGTEHAQIVSDVVLRSQSQAIYSPANIGHFGLALGQYAHFTSPIRRYADLLVHRALIRVYKLGDDGLTDDEIEKMETLGEHISGTERRSIMAEREATDRFIALYLEEKVDTVFTARVSGVARFGLFVQLDETGADGIVPFSSLPRDYYELDEAKQALVGQRKGLTYTLAQPVKVRLVEANPLTSAMSFAILEEGGGEDKKPSPRPKNKSRGKSREKSNRISNKKSASKSTKDKRQPRKK